MLLALDVVTGVGVGVEVAATVGAGVLVGVGVEVGVGVGDATVMDKLLTVGVSDEVPVKLIRN